MFGKYNNNNDVIKTNENKNNILEHKKFNCIICDYYTNKKCNYIKHNMTSKHLEKMEIFGNIWKSKSSKNVIECKICEICNKEYKTSSGLWKHKKTCKKNENIELNINNLKIFEILHLFSFKTPILNEYIINNSS